MFQLSHIFKNVSETYIHPGPKLTPKVPLQPLHPHRIAVTSTAFMSTADSTQLKTETLFHQRHKPHQPQSSRHSSSSSPTNTNISNYSQAVFVREKNTQAYKHLVQTDKTSMVLPVICTSVLCVFLIALFCMW